MNIVCVYEGQWSCYIAHQEFELCRLGLFSKPKTSFGLILFKFWATKEKTDYYSSSSSAKGPSLN